jgi:hypothetical protein
MQSTIAESRGNRRGWAAGLLAAAALTASTAASDADACGGFFARRAATATVPSLQVEQALIVHDPDSEQEHFIRELVFRDAKEPFGLVVPTPSQPTVTRVDGSPFPALAERFPPEPDEGIGLAGIGQIRSGVASGHGKEAPKVTVISRERIGSFTAFVLSASDAGALKKWLDDNQLVTTPESEAWLRHYTDLGFHFVAFRHEPASKGANTSRSETVRISFSTPLPYYPYREPEHLDGNPALYRVLAVWLISTRRSVPMATLQEGSSLLWKRPWQEARHGADPTALDVSKLLARPVASLLPPGFLFTPPADSWGVDTTPTRRLVVQSFEDQKLQRQGWGDVVLVPESPAPMDAAHQARLGKLMATLDPSYQEKP